MHVFAQRDTTERSNVFLSKSIRKKLKEIRCFIVFPLSSSLSGDLRMNVKLNWENMKKKLKKCKDLSTALVSRIARYVLSLTRKKNSATIVDKNHGTRSLGPFGLVHPPIQCWLEALFLPRIIRDSFDTDLIWQLRAIDLFWALIIYEFTILQSDLMNVFFHDSKSTWQSLFSA